VAARCFYHSKQAAAEEESFTMTQPVFVPDRTSREFTYDLWRDCPFEAMRSNPRLGFAYYNDFIGDHTGTTTTGVGGSLTLTAIAGTPTVAMDNFHGGSCTMTAAAATDTHGGILNPGSATAACITPAVGRICYFEMLFKQTLQTSTLGSSFIGFATQAAGMTTTGAITATDYIGWQALDAATAKFTYLNASATLYAGSTIGTYVSAQWTKVGFRIDGLTSVTPYYNGARQDTIAATSTKSIPDDIMNATWQIVSGGGTGTPTITADWVRFACYDERTSVVTL
jgi:hypothetical protein